MPSTTIKNIHFKLYDKLIKASQASTPKDPYGEFIASIKSISLSAGRERHVPSDIECTAPGTEDIDFFRAHFISAEKGDIYAPFLHLPYKPEPTCSSITVIVGSRSIEQKKELLYIIKEENYIKDYIKGLSAQQMAEVGSELFPGVPSAAYTEHQKFEIGRQICYADTEQVAALNRIRRGIFSKKETVLDTELNPYKFNGRAEKARARYNIESRLRIIRQRVDELVNPQDVFGREELTKDETEALSQIRHELLANAMQDAYSQIYMHTKPPKATRQYLSRKTHSNLDLATFGKLAPDHINISRFLLEIRHQHRTLEQSKDIDDDALPMYLRERATEPFITYNGAVLYSLTENQREIIKELDRNLKEGKTSPQDIALGVGEGKSFLAELLQKVYGPRNERQDDIISIGGNPIGCFLVQAPRAPSPREASHEVPLPRESSGHKVVPTLVKKPVSNKKPVPQKGDAHPSVSSPRHKGSAFHSVVSVPHTLVSASHPIVPVSSRASVSHKALATKRQSERIAGMPAEVDVFTTDASVGIESLSLSNLAGTTREKLLAEIEAIKEKASHHKGRKAIIFDEFPHLDYELRTLLRKALPEHEYNMLFISATPNTIALRVSSKINNNSSDIRKAELVEGKKEAFLRGLAGTNVRVANINEGLDSGQGFLNRFLEGGDLRFAGITDNIQWMLPDLGSEQIDALIRANANKILTKTQCNDIVYKDARGKVIHIRKTGRDTIVIDDKVDTVTVAPAKCLMVYSSADSIGGDFGKLSRRVGAQVIYSANPPSTSLLQQWTARYRRDNMMIIPESCQLVINVAARSKAEFIDTLQIAEKNHEELDIINYLKNCIMGELSRDDGKEFDKPQRKFIRKLARDGVKFAQIKEWFEREFPLVKLDCKDLAKIDLYIANYQLQIDCLNPGHGYKSDFGTAFVQKELKLRYEVSKYESFIAQEHSGLAATDIVGIQAKKTERLNKIKEVIEKINASDISTESANDEKLLLELATIGYALSQAKEHFSRDVPFAEVITSLKEKKAAIIALLNASEEPIPHDSARVIDNLIKKVQNLVRLYDEKIITQEEFEKLSAGWLTKYLDTPSLREHKAVVLELIAEIGIKISSNGYVSDSEVEHNIRDTVRLSAAPVVKILPEEVAELPGAVVSPGSSIAEKTAYFNLYTKLAEAIRGKTPHYGKFMTSIQAISKPGNEDAIPSDTECTSPVTEDIDFFQAHFIGAKKSEIKSPFLDLPYVSENPHTCKSIKVSGSKSANQKKELLYLLKEEDYINSCDSEDIPPEQIAEIGSKLFPGVANYTAKQTFEIKRYLCYRNEEHMDALLKERGRIIGDERFVPDTELAEYLPRRQEIARARYNIESRLRIIKERVYELVNPQDVFGKPEEALIDEEREALEQIRNELLANAMQDAYNQIYVHTKPPRLAKSTTAQYLSTDVHSNLEMEAFGRLAPTHTNLSRFFLEARHKQKKLEKTKDTEDDKLPLYLKTRANEPFITYNGAVLYSLTDSQLAIIKELDDNLKKGISSPQDIALGVGEGKSFLAELLQKVYGPRRVDQADIVIGKAIIGHFIGVVQRKSSKHVEKISGMQTGEGVFVKAPVWIESLSLGNLAGKTKEELRDILREIKRKAASEKGSKIIIFDEFPHLDYELRALIRKELPESEYNMLFISATPNTVALRTSSVINHKVADATKADRIEHRKEVFVEGLSEANVHVENIATGDRSFLNKLKDQSIACKDRTGNIQWMLPDLSSEQIETLIKNNVYDILTSMGFNSIVFKDPSGIIRCVEFDHGNIIYSTNISQASSKSLMVYSSADSIGGDFGELSRHVSAQIIYSVNPFSTSLLQQWTARYRRENMETIPSSCQLIINAPARTKEEFIDTLQIAEKNHEELDSINYLKSCIIGALSRSDAKEFTKEQRKFIRDLAKDGVRFVQIKERFEARFESEFPTVKLICNEPEKIDLYIANYQSQIRRLNPSHLYKSDSGATLSQKELKLKYEITKYESFIAQEQFSLSDTEEHQTQKEKRLEELKDLIKKINNTYILAKAITDEQLLLDLGSIGYALSQAKKYCEEESTFAEVIHSLQEHKDTIITQLKVSQEEIPDDPSNVRDNIIKKLQYLIRLYDAKNITKEDFENLLSTWLTRYLNNEEIAQYKDEVLRLIAGMKDQVGEGGYLSDIVIETRIKDVFPIIPRFESSAEILSIKKPSPSPAPMFVAAIPSQPDLSVENERAAFIAIKGLFTRFVELPDDATENRGYLGGSTGILIQVGQFKNDISEAVTRLSEEQITTLVIRLKEDPEFVALRASTVTNSVTVGSLLTAELSKFDGIADAISNYKARVRAKSAGKAINQIFIDILGVTDENDFRRLEIAYRDNHHMHALNVLENTAEGDELREIMFVVMEQELPYERAVIRDLALLQQKFLELLKR